MNKEQFVQVVTMIVSGYAKGKEVLGCKEALTTWYGMLRDIDGDVLLAATKVHLATSPFLPTIENLRSISRMILAGVVDTTLLPPNVAEEVKSMIRVDYVNGCEDDNGDNSQS